ncbi:hypothetical protein REPUB_Repub15cG0115100 [Reevesia pubescens]
MDNVSSLEFDSYESDLDVQAENYEEHGKMEDEIQKILDFCVSEDEKVAELSGGSLSLNADKLEPYTGMEFNSRDEAREFYAAYGRRTGFTVCIHHNRFRAKKYIHRKDRVLPPPPIIREGCQAMIRLTLRDGVKWVATKYVKGHNHKLMSPNKVPWRGSGNHFVSEDEKDKRIRELSLELYNERQKCKRRCAAYEEQLNLILKDLENHTQHISKTVADILQSTREIEEEKVGLRL